MAQFCTKCGSPLAEGMKFCIGCGATVGAPGAPTAQAPAAQPPAVAAPSPAPVAPAPAPAAPAPMAPAAAAPAAKSGSPVVKIILIVLAVLLLLGLLGVGSCVFLLYRAKQKVKEFEKQAGVTMTMPTGTPQAPTEPGATGQPTGPVIDLGVPVYPGATPTRAGTSMSVGTSAIKSQEYATSDSVDQVIAFYKEKLGPKAMVTQSGQQALVQMAGSNGYVNIAIAPDSKTGKTKITISSIGK